MEIVRTIRLKLLPTEEQKRELALTLEANRQALNYASQVAFEEGGITAFKKLQKMVYRDLREKFGLKSQMACNVCSVVAGTYASAKSNKRLKRAVFRKQKLLYSYNRDYSFGKEPGIVSLGTLQRRIKLPFQVGDNHRPYLLDRDWQYGTAELVFRRKGYFLHVTVKRVMEEPDIHACDAVIGVDRGMNFLAVATDQNDRAFFFRGKAIKNKKASYVRLRKELQGKGTRSAKRKLKELAGRENRFMTDVNHQVANQILRFAKTAGKRTCLVLEDLTNINLRTTVHRKDHYWRFSWAFAQLEKILCYKAAAEGIPVIRVSSRYTSQQCPRCGHTEKANRDKKNHRFHCQACGYQLNDDLAAARNIRDRGMRELPLSEALGA